jgi:hypothetical protein
LKNPSIAQAEFTPDGIGVICAGSCLSITELASKRVTILAEPSDDAKAILRSFHPSPEYYTALDVRQFENETRIVVGSADGDLNLWKLIKQ